MDRFRNTWRATLIAALLGAVTLATFWPVLHNDFIRYDDRDYITANPHVLSGLNWDGVKWAFTTAYASNWHPLTWLSHMMDVQLFGVRPAWHHFISLLLHIANTVLLFLLLRRLTGADWRSAFVAGFFALHPLHVESVAWAAERKDVLSALFFVLTLSAYVLYAEAWAKWRATSVKCQVPGVTSQVPGPKPKVSSPEGQAGSRESHWLGVEGAGPVTGARPQEVQDVSRTAESSDRVSRITHSSAEALAKADHASLYYFLSLSLFALGLMSKPMLVTVPFVLLLLDFWPLKRAGWKDTVSRLNWVALLREKVPFFGLALISSVITYMAQGRGHAVTIVLPLWVRLGNAVVSYWKYLGKTIWPTDLSILYPHPATRYPVTELWPGWLLGAAALALVAVIVLVAIRRQRAPWSTVGWLWYVGLLVPVIGLVQVGQQAMADRYTYLPLIGIFIGVVWGTAEMSANARWASRLLGAVGVVALVVCAAVTQRQVQYWRNNLTVFEHALAVNPNNSVALCHVGIELGEQKKYEAAIQEFEQALKADPNSAEAYYGLGYTLENLGKLPDAMEQYRNALRARPWYEPARSRLGTTLWSLGQLEQALTEYEAALRQNPDDLEVQYRLGMALLRLGQPAQAVPHLGYVAQANPDFGNVIDQLTEVLLAQGKLAEAAGRLSEVVARFPANASARLNLGRVLLQNGKPDQAMAQYQEALRLDPANPAAHYLLGTALSLQDKLAEAASELAEAIRLNPDYLAARVRLGEVLAGRRKMNEAVNEFREAVRLSPTNASLVLNLANTLLMAGRTNEAAPYFAEAVRLRPDLPEKLAETARALAGQGNVPAAIARFTTALYLKPEAQSCFELAGLLLHQGNAKEAVNRYQQALQLKPDWIAAMNQLAWVLATDQNAEVRNGAEAVRLAERACELDGGKDPRLLATLAAAYAETGKFAEAVATGEKAKALATAAGQNEIVAEIGAEIAAYQKQMPWRK
jgi:tetratricopeptide (TPR) repeat protein